MSGSLRSKAKAPVRKPGLQARGKRPRSLKHAFRIHTRSYCGRSRHFLATTFREELQGNKTSEFSVLRFVDNTHSTAAQILNDPVVRDGLTDESG